MNSQNSPIKGSDLLEELKTTFTRITGTDENTLGQGASLDINKGMASIDFAFELGKKNLTKFDLLSFRIKGGSSDGLFSVFSNSKFNTNVSFNVDYQLIDFSKSYIRNITRKGKKEKSGFKINWFSIGYSLNHNEISLFDQTADFVNQKKKENYISHKFVFKYNIFKWSKYDPWSFFFSAGLNYSLRDNSEFLREVKLEEITSLSNNSEIRNIVNEYQALTGLYKNGINEVRLYSDLYIYPFSNNTVAIHFFPDIQFISKEKPLTNLEVGIMTPFTKKGNKSSYVNLELYYRFLDLGNNTNSSYKLKERNNIGFRLSFPINF